MTIRAMRRKSCNRSVNKVNLIEFSSVQTQKDKQSKWGVTHDHSLNFPIPSKKKKFDKNVWVVINCKILLTRGTEKQTLLLVGHKHATFIQFCLREREVTLQICYSLVENQWEQRPKTY